MNAKLKTTKTRGQMVSFKLEQDVLDLVRKESFDRRIPLSMWLREAAREKLAAENADRQGVLL